MKKTEQNLVIRAANKRLIFYRLLMLYYKAVVGFFILFGILWLLAPGLLFSMDPSKSNLKALLCLSIIYVNFRLLARGNTFLDDALKKILDKRDDLKAAICLEENFIYEVKSEENLL